MKRITIYFLVCILATTVIGLTSCKGKKADGQQQEQPSANQTTLQPSQLADGKVKDMDAKMFNERIVNLDVNNRQYLSPVPSVIDCYATWCGPCKQQAPILEQLAKEYKGKVAFYRIDVEKEPSFTMDLGVSAMPTLFFVSPGKTKSAVGFHSLAEVKKQIEELLKP